MEAQSEPKGFMNSNFPLVSLVFLSAAASFGTEAAELQNMPDANIELVRTASYEIELSSVGAIPVRWEIVDPTVTSSGNAIDLISKQLPIDSAKRPLTLVSPVLDQIIPEHRSACYSVDRDDRPNATRIRYISPFSDSGIRIARIYEIPHDGWVSTLRTEIFNGGPRLVSFRNIEAPGLGIALGPGLGLSPQRRPGIGGGLYSFIRPVFARPGRPRAEVLKPIPGEVIFVGEPLQWAGIHRRYFLAALMPSTTPAIGLAAELARISPPDDDSLAPAPNFAPRVVLNIAVGDVAPGEIFAFETRLFFGPKRFENLRREGLDQVLFPGLWNWMRNLCFALQWLLNLLYGGLHSWGLSIIALAAAVRLLLFPIAKVGLRQQAKMAHQQSTLKLRLAEIDERWADNPQRRSHESWLAYKEHGVSPISAAKGCLWLLVQIPVFIALFNLLGQSFALRGAGFLWISDLAEPDHLFPIGIQLPFFGGYFNLLPFVMAASQVFVTSVSATPSADAADRERQRRFMFAMALLFLVLFYSFPSGLVLYWLMSNLGQLVQQSLMGRGELTHDAGIADC
jgi:YidC/Oxa1 family membrane protein insertase